MVEMNPIGNSDNASMIRLRRELSPQYIEALWDMDHGDGSFIYSSRYKFNGRGFKRWHMLGRKPLK